MGQGELEARNNALTDKYNTIRQLETLYDAHQVSDAEMIVVASGIAARITLSAVKELRLSGKKIGLFRPITLFPFPEKALARMSRGKTLMVVEMNAGQMVDDVRLAVNGRSEVLFYGRPGGVVFTPEDVKQQLLTAYRRYMRKRTLPLKR
jgi:2-oxoglutarate ferredoxin oxidoreductase subunit alpha